MANEASMKPYICTICGHIYDPAVGEPAQGIAPGIAFVNLPDEWVCPVCGAGKALFQER